MDLCDIKASMVYRERQSSRTAKVLQRNPVSENKTNKKETSDLELVLTFFSNVQLVKKK